jgi:hypothetical protein
MSSRTFSAAEAIKTREAAIELGCVAARARLSAVCGGREWSVWCEVILRRHEPCDDPQGGPRGGRASLHAIEFLGKPCRALYTSLCCILLLLAACSDGPLRRHGGRHLGRPGDLLLACAPQGGPLFKYAFSTHSPPPWIVCPCSAFTRPGRRCPGPTFSLASHADCSRHVAAEPWEHAIFGVCGGWWLAHKLLQGEQYYEELTAKIVREKMDRNRGVLDEKYRSLLGDNYSKYFKES